jgi:ADP-ribose pyrophosphatase
MESLMALSRDIYAGRIVHLSIETVTLPNGATVELEIVHHPGAAAVVALQSDGTVLLVRQYRHAAGDYLLEIPAGTLHPGEDPRDCALRELEEEVGCRAGRLDFLCAIYTTPGFTDERIHLYRAAELTPGAQALDHDEVLDVVAMPLEDAIREIQRGGIRDAKSIVGLQLVFLATRS